MTVSPYPFELDQAIKACGYWKSPVDFSMQFRSFTTGTVLLSPPLGYR